MSRRLWGCYSVADHLEPRAFVADLLLYDRLVVPVPSPDDIARWEKRWDPERQARLLDILGPFARREEWSPALREQFEREWSPSDAALDIDAITEAAGAYPATRRIVSEQLGKKVAKEGDVRGVAVYASPDRFDREWELTRTLPFVRRTTRVEAGELREARAAASLQGQRLARLVVTRLVVPDDGDTDEEVLKRTVELVSRDDVAKRRAEFHELLASLEAEGGRDETVVGEIEDLLDAYNELVRQRTTAQRARVVVHAITAAEGVAALAVPPLGPAAGATAAVGEAAIRRRWGGHPSDAEVGAVSLLAEAQRAL